MGESVLVIGAGVIGGRVAGMLAERGNRVSVVSRHGSGPQEVNRVAADAADALGEEGVAVGRILAHHVVQLAEDLERDDTEQVRPHHQRALDKRGRDARGQVGANRGEGGRQRLGFRILGIGIRDAAGGRRLDDDREQQRGHP